MSTRNITDHKVNVSPIKKRERRIRAQADEVADNNEGPLLVMDGFDGCLLGVVTLTDGSVLVCYDRARVLKQLIRQGMTFEEAAEFHSFNQVGAYMGEGTPVFVDVFK